MINKWQNNNMEYDIADEIFSLKGENITAQGNAL